MLKQMTVMIMIYAYIFMSLLCVT